MQTIYTDTDFIQQALFNVLYSINTVLKNAEEFLYKVIYDYPTMIRHRHLVDRKMKKNVLCAGIFIRKDQLTKINDHTYGIKTHSVGEQKNLIASDYFYNERFLKNAAGTCFVKDKKTISTAYHIINATGLSTDLFIKNYVALFGFTDSSEKDIYINKSQIVELESTANADKSLDADSIDFTIKNELPSFIEVPKLHHGAVKPEMEIYIAGYPLRTSLTISSKAIINKKQENYFTTHADLFEYSSGSPVFLAENNQLIGFVKGNGEKDFIETEDKVQHKTNVIASSESFGKKILLIKQ